VGQFVVRVLLLAYAAWVASLVVADLKGAL
jgi:hypothetical protein